MSSHCGLVPFPVPAVALSSGQPLYNTNTDSLFDPFLTKIPKPTHRVRHKCVIWELILVIKVGIKETGIISDHYQANLDFLHQIKLMWAYEFIVFNKF